MTVPIPSRVSQSPIFNDTIFLNNDGKPLAGGMIYTYEGGGFSAFQTTFADSTGQVANANPIVLDASGRMHTALWLADGYTYNVTLTDSNNVLLASHDNVSAVASVQAGGGIGTVIWNIASQSPVYVSSSQFSLLTDFTVEFTTGNRVRWQYNDNSFGYGVVTNVTWDATYTYVTVLADSVAFSNAVTNVAWSSLIVNNYTSDAGAIGFTPTFTYSGSNVGTKLQTINNLVTAHSKSYIATLSGTAYSVTTDFGPTNYTGMAIDVQFTTGSNGVPRTINVNNIGQVELLQFAYSGSTQNPVITDNMCSRVMFNGTAMILLNQLPYTPPVPPPPAFNPTMGTVNPSGGAFTVTAGPSGKIAITVSNAVHALYGNFGAGNVILYANGTEVHRAPTWFFEWDSRQGGGNPTNIAAISATPGDVVTFTVTWAGPGTVVNPSTWLAITA